MTHSDSDRDTSPIAAETCLGDPAGRHVCWVVEPDGSWWPWVLQPDAPADHGCSCARCAPHERLGPYPLPRAAVCGAPTTSGGRCARRVDDNRPCWQHRNRTRQETR